MVCLKLFSHFLSIGILANKFNFILKIRDIVPDRVVSIRMLCAVWRIRLPAGEGLVKQVLGRVRMLLNEAEASVVDQFDVDIGLGEEIIQDGVTPFPKMSGEWFLQVAVLVRGGH